MLRHSWLAALVLVLMGGCNAGGGGGGGGGTAGPRDDVTPAIRTACVGNFQNEGQLAAYVARVVIARNSGVSYEQQLLADQNACANPGTPANCLGCVTEVNQSVYGR